MSGVMHGIFARALARLTGWISGAAADCAPPDTSNVAAMPGGGAAPRAPYRSIFLLAARLRATARLNPPIARKPQLSGATNRPARISATIKRQQRETRHVWLTVRHKPANVAARAGNVTTLCGVRRSRPGIPVTMRTAGHQRAA